MTNLEEQLIQASHSASFTLSHLQEALELALNNAHPLLEFAIKNLIETASKVKTGCDSIVSALDIQGGSNDEA